MALDVGERRIGVALADEAIGIAVAYETIEVDGNEIANIAEIAMSNQVDTIVVGYPRNQSGEPTKQTEFVEQFCQRLVDIDAQVVYQDESLTSVEAERILGQQKRPYAKSDIDSMAASLILQDYLEGRRGRS